MLENQSLTALATSRSALKEIILSELIPAWQLAGNLRGLRKLETFLLPDIQCLALLTYSDPSSPDQDIDQFVISFRPEGTRNQTTPGLAQVGLERLFLPPSGAYEAAMLPANRQITSMEDANFAWLIESGILDDAARQAKPDQHVLWNAGERHRERREEQDASAANLDPIWITGTSREGILRRVREEIVPFFWPDATLLLYENFETIYAPGEECVTTADLRLRIGQEVIDATIIMTTRRPEELPAESGARIYVSPSREYAASVFPDDAELPGLAVALDPAAVLASLRSAGELPSDGIAYEVETAVLRYRPHERCVIRYTIRNALGDTVLQSVSKVYDDNETALDVWTTLNELRAGLDEPDLVVRPIALDAENNIIIMEFIEGKTLGAQMDETTDEAEMKHLTQTAARALATLHNVDFKHARLKTFATEVGRLRDHSVALRSVSPELAQEMDARLDDIEAAGRAFDELEPSFVHGGFKPTQIVMRNGRPAVLDFDGSCIGDPALDAGRFMAKLRFDALDPARAHLGDLDRYFIDSYADISIRDIAARAPVYEALALVRMTSRRFETNAASANSSRGLEYLMALLQEAAACVREAGVQASQ